jgi:hypothetical protein
MKTFADVWAEYEARIPKGASDIQHLETRRAFYAGALSFLALQCEAADEDLSDEAGASEIERWKDEIVAFLRSIS